MRKIVTPRSVSYFLEALCWTLGIVLLLGWLAARVSGELERRAAIEKFTEAAVHRHVLATVAAQRRDRQPGLLVRHEPDQKLWSKGRRRAYAAAESNAKTEANPATVDAILRIPRVGLEVPVYDQVDELNLNRGAGLIAHTAKPGSNGNVAIAAHRDGYFRALKGVSLGDVVELQTSVGTREYRISRIYVVSPKDVKPLAPTAVPSVTLVTCYPFYFVGPAPQRYIVRAVATASTL